MQLDLFNGLLRFERASDKTRAEGTVLSVLPDIQPPLTMSVPLPGDTSRLRQMILYVASKCEKAEFFGAIKLNKIIWKADFDSFAARHIPVTGSEYRRRKFGPALLKMLPVHREMLRDGAIRVDRRSFGKDEEGNEIIEERTIALDRPEPRRFFSDEDLRFVDAAIEHYWNMTGTETSDESHGIAWKTRNNGDPMPYELALLSDEPLDSEHLAHIEQLIYERGWVSE